MLASGIWEDEDARKFYEDLPDLQVLVPGVFLESNPPKKADESKEEEETEQKQVDNETPAAPETEEKVNEEQQEAPSPPAPQTPADDNDEPDVDPSELMENALK